MNWVEMVTSVAEFLCTYLVHSTLILLPVWWLVVKYRWPADPGIRCQLLKISFLAPLGTTLALTVGGVPHFGLQIPLVSRGFQETAEAGYGRVNLSPANFNGYASSPGLASSTNRAENFASSNDSRRPVGHLANASAEFTGRRVFLTAMVVLWATIVAVGLLRLGLQWTKLRRILRNAIEIVDPRLLEEKACLRTQFGIRRSIALLSSSQAQVPMGIEILHLLPQHNARLLKHILDIRRIDQLLSDKSVQPVTMLHQQSHEGGCTVVGIRLYVSASQLRGLPLSGSSFRVVQE